MIHEAGTPEQAAALRHFCERNRLCPRCFAQNRVATVAGPTCTCNALFGDAWFPSWWLSGGEERRTTFLQRINTTTI